MDFQMKRVRVGDRVKGEVYKVTKEAVYLDFGAFTEGVIYTKGLSLEPIDSCLDIVSEGQELEAVVTKVDMEHGSILLSRIDMLRKEKFSNFISQKGTKEVISAKVIKSVNGGLILKSNGIEMFMPISQISVNMVEPNDYLDKTLDVEIMEVKGRKVVVSHKVIEKRLLKQKALEEFATFKVDQVLKGTVSKITAFGAFVKFEYNEGLLHISQLSHHRIEKVGEVVKEQDEVEVKIIKIDKNRLSLSMRALQKTPWEIFADENKQGDKVEGRIVRKTGNNMLIEVARDVVGIINKNDFSWDPRENFAGTVEVGDKVSLKILSMDVKGRKMSLSKKHLDYNPWNDVTVKINDEVMGTVKEFQSNGAIITVQGVNAFLPISEITDRHIMNASDELNKEEAINVIITKLDKKMWKMVVSKKGLIEKREQKEFAEYKKTEEKAQVTTIGDLFKDHLEKMKK